MSSPLQKIPVDIILLFFDFLDVNNLFNFVQTSRRIYKIYQNHHETIVRNSLRNTLDNKNFPLYFPVNFQDRKFRLYQKNEESLQIPGHFFLLRYAKELVLLEKAIHILTSQLVQFRLDRFYNFPPEDKKSLILMIDMIHTCLVYIGQRNIYKLGNQWVTRDLLEQGLITPMDMTSFTPCFNPDSWEYWAQRPGTGVIALEDPLKEWNSFWIRVSPGLRNFAGKTALFIFRLFEIAPVLKKTVGLKAFSPNKLEFLHPRLLVEMGNFVAPSVGRELEVYEKSRYAKNMVDRFILQSG